MSRIRTDANCSLHRPPPMPRIRILKRKNNLRHCAFVPLCLCVVLAFLLTPGITFAQIQPPNDYSDGKSWLCRPDRHDACDVDLTTTIIAPDGKLTRESFFADPKSPIDCFYVYPTVS